MLVSNNCYIVGIIHCDNYTIVLKLRYYLPGKEISALVIIGAGGNEARKARGVRRSENGAIVVGGALSDLLFLIIT